MESFRPLFNSYLMEALEKTGIRDLKLLKNLINEVLSRISEDYPERDDIPIKVPCSKHWWFNYMEKNKELKTLWEDLPLKRTLEAGKKNSKAKVKKENDEQTQTTNLSSPCSEDFSLEENNQESVFEEEPNPLFDAGSSQMEIEDHEENISSPALM